MEKPFKLSKSLETVKVQILKVPRCLKTRGALHRTSPASLLSFGGSSWPDAQLLQASLGINGHIKMQFLTWRLSRNLRKCLKLGGPVAPQAAEQPLPAYPPYKSSVAHCLTEALWHKRSIEEHLTNCSLGRFVHFNTCWRRTVCTNWSSQHLWYSTCSCMSSWTTEWAQSWTPSMLLDWYTTYHNFIFLSPRLKPSSNLWVSRRVWSCSI